MCESICRICGKIVEEKNPIILFENQNKEILYKIKDLTGLMLKNYLAFPKVMCCICKKDLEDAYKFRDDFLKVQASFRVKFSKENKKQTHNEMTETTEFVQVFDIKEENNAVFGSHDVYTEDEKQEMNIANSEKFNKKQTMLEEKDEMNALELKTSEENTVEDTEFAIDDTYKSFSYNEDVDNKERDEEHKPETEVMVAKMSKWIRGIKKSDYLNGERVNRKIKRKIAKFEIKRKEHPNIFICDQCGNHFRCRRYFNLHLRRHLGDKRLACELCTAKFLTTSELKRHIRTHTGERPFTCKYCDRRFADHSTRIKHERTHTNERPFVCSQCGKSFTASNTLKNHMLTHTGERNFKCDVCKRDFARRTHLVVHLRSITHKQAVNNKKCSLSLSL